MVQTVSITAVFVVTPGKLCSKKIIVDFLNLLAHSTVGPPPMAHLGFLAYRRSKVMYLSIYRPICRSISPSVLTGLSDNFAKFLRTV